MFKTSEHYICLLNEKFSFTTIVNSNKKFFMVSFFKETKGRNPQLRIRILNIDNMRNIIQKRDSVTRRERQYL